MNQLTKQECCGLEIPPSDIEIKINKMVLTGYKNVNIMMNDALSLAGFLKTYHIHEYIFETYILPKLDHLSKKYKFTYQLQKFTKCNIKKADRIRLSNMDKNLPKNIYEFVLLDLLKQMYKYPNKKWFYFYTLNQLEKYNVDHNSSLLIYIIKDILEKETTYKLQWYIHNMLTNASLLFENNKYTSQFADIKLYDHQKQLFTYCKQQNPKLIQYVAPTGTGKTISPIGLSVENKIIFVCAARHVGLALAKSAISTNIKIAFAFGCNDTSGIKLHYNAAKLFIKNKRSGGIAKVDNTVGENVEIMISDIHSYIHAMHYMLAFNSREKIILYWDEPTISLDYKQHEYHEIIQRNWQENLIPNVVLSSATLPEESDIIETIMDFRSRFSDADVYRIDSHDCRKTIPIISKDGTVAMPHTLSDDYQIVLKSVAHCRKYPTIMRYLDITEISKFITLAQDDIGSPYCIENVFTTIDSINIVNIKEYYLTVLENIEIDNWYQLCSKAKSRPRYNSTIHMVGRDAHTLTYGPTMFIADNVMKVAKFCLQEAKIPHQMLETIRKSMKRNDRILEKINVLQKQFEDGTKNDKEKKASDGRMSQDMRDLKSKINQLSEGIRCVSLDARYIPNKREHIERFDSMKYREEAYTSDISESVVTQIMQIDNIDDTLKILMMMGIGVFIESADVSYMEILKKLVEQQKMYLLIASSDYIYGTNYQFCHQYISRDLSYMSQEKCIQAMGRVGRNQVNQKYSIRTRDDAFIHKIFMPEANKPEVANMSRLFA